MATVLQPPHVVLSRAPSAPAALLHHHHDGDAQQHQHQQQPALLRGGSGGSGYVPRDEILTLRPASPQPASPQPPAVEKQHSEPFPVPSKPKRVRSVSGALDLAAVSIPSARLIAHEGGRSHTIYDLHVRPMGRISGWDVHRRYSNFVELHATLLAAHPHATPPPLPPKRWFGATSPAFIERRRAALEGYLEGLVANETLRRSKEFRLFVGLGEWGAGLSYNNGSLPGSGSGSGSGSVAAPHSGTDPQRPIAIPRASSAAELYSSFPYAGGSFVSRAPGGKLSGAGRKKTTGRATAAARNGWTDVLVVAAPSPTGKAAKAETTHKRQDEKQEGPKQGDDGDGHEHAHTAPSSSYCGIM